MNMKQAIILSMLLLSTACSQMNQAETPPETIQALTGTWQTASGKNNIRFYDDQTVKLSFPEHQPAFKLISDYQIIKEHGIGITLGGVWTGPALVNIDQLDQQIITVTLPDEASILMHQTSK